MPRGFKLPSDHRKYDGSEEPKTWLQDHLTAVRCCNGTKVTAMQSLQLHLRGPARTWLESLPPNSIHDWSELKKTFIRNFNATYKRPASIEEVRACIQRHNEPVRSYIQRWTTLKNSAEDISEERAIDAFTNGVQIGRAHV